MGGRRWPIVIHPLDRRTLRRLVSGQTVNGELQGVSPPFRRLVAHLAGRDVIARQAALDGFLCGLLDLDASVKALAEDDASGPPPEAGAVER